MDSKLFFNQVRLQLPRMDGVAIKNENDNMYFYVDGRKEFYVRPTGGLSFETDCSYTDKVKQISDLVVKSSRYAHEYLSAIEEAPELKVDGLEKEFKLIAQFNNTVLAARIMQNENVEFVTWDKGPRGMSAGHYYGNNFIGAKEDFASRANLVNPDKIFSTDELVEIYRCVEDTLAGEYELTNGQEEMLGGIKEKIIEVVPDILERAIEAEEDFAQEQNEGQIMM